MLHKRIWLSAWHLLGLHTLKIHNSYPFCQFSFQNPLSPTCSQLSAWHIEIPSFVDPEWLIVATGDTRLWHAWTQLGAVWFLDDLSPQESTKTEGSCENELPSYTERELYRLWSKRGFGNPPAGISQVLTHTKQRRSERWWKVFSFFPPHSHTRPLSPKLDLVVFLNGLLHFFKNQLDTNASHSWISTIKMKDVSWGSMNRNPAAPPACGISPAWWEPGWEGRVLQPVPCRG